MAERQKTAPGKRTRPSNETAKRATRTARTPKAAANGKAAAGSRRQLFTPVPAPTRVDYPLLEDAVQRWWDEHDVLHKYLHRNDDAAEHWSFIDGPMTA